MMPVGALETNVVLERRRLAETLAHFCGLPGGRTAEACARPWCGYFDADRGRCALLVWDIPAHIGVDGLRWFATHRPTKVVEPDDGALCARVSVL